MNTQKKKIEAKIIADSVNEFGNRITTFVITFPRFILAELNTHRMFSRNSASSRAIPFKKMVEMVEEDPFIPVAWQKDHKGMQGTEYIEDTEIIIEEWINASKIACQYASELNDNTEDLGVTKQLCNRLLEPFMWHTAIITATEFDNFFELRCPQYEFPSISNKSFRSKKDVRDFTHFANRLSDQEWLLANKGAGEIHIMALAEAMWDAMNESTPKELKDGEWHIPFGEQIQEEKLFDTLNQTEYFEDYYNSPISARIKIATARCARVSYLNFEGKDDYMADIKLHDGLLESGHYSPFEHCARAMGKADFNIEVYDDNGNEYTGYSDEFSGWSGNLKGFVQYRKTLENS